MKHFSPDVYKTRRKELSKHLKQGVVLFMGNSESPRNYPENTYRFRQDSSFLYFCGLTRAGLIILNDLENEKTTLFGNEITEDDIIWTGAQPALTELASRAGIDQVYPMSHLPKTITTLLAKKTPIHYLPPYRVSTKVKLSRLLQISVDEIGENASKELINAVVSMRSVKEDREIQEIERALNLTRELHLNIMYSARPGIQEKKLVGRITELVEACSFELAYQIILTVHGEILHNMSHMNTLKKGQLLLGDFGAETDMGYASDITRTIPVDNVFNTQQKEIYQVVLEAQLAAIEMLSPGVLNRDVHLMAARKIVSGLKEVGVMRGDIDEAVASGAHTLFYPHGIGHMIGLDVHDMEDLGEDYVGYAAPEITRNDQFGLKSLRLAKRLEPGYTITVEPGIYFIPDLIDNWENKKKGNAFIDFRTLSHFRSMGGIRIEDNYLITATGARLLGTSIPKTIEELEFLREPSVDEVDQMYKPGSHPGS